jgi:hypothetical protein
VNLPPVAGSQQRVRYRRTDGVAWTLTTVVPSPDGPEDWKTLTWMTFVPGGNENVAVCRLPVVTAVAGVPPSKIHS